MFVRDGGGMGKISPLPGFSQETWEEGADGAPLTWVNDWLPGTRLPGECLRSRLAQTARWQLTTGAYCAGGGGLSRAALCAQRS